MPDLFIAWWDHHCKWCRISVIRGVHAIFHLMQKFPIISLKKQQKKHNLPNKTGKECYKEDAPDRTDSRKKINRQGSSKECYKGGLIGKRTDSGKKVK